MIKKLNLFFLLILVYSETLFAQNNQVEMAFTLRESGKIYVVVSVLLLIFIGIVTYLISIDRKLKKLEDQVNKQN